MNHIPFYFENKSQNNFCEAVPNAAVFIVVFQVHVNYLALKFNQNEFDEKLFFEVIRNRKNFRLRSFLYQGTLWQKIQAAVSYKIVSYMRALTVTPISSYTNPLIVNPSFRHFFVSC